MWFNSLDYLFFFLVVYSIYWISPKNRQKYILLLASFFFYAYWSIPFFFHFLGITAISYFFIGLIRKTKKKRYLIAGVGLNLTNLLFFKYTQSIINGLLSIENTEPDSFLSSLPEVILPLAISFYTFQIIAFIVDTYREETAGIGFFDYLLFIFFFPQLIAGPIMRHSDFFHQLGNTTLTESSVKEALLRILSGVFKKVYIADQMARIINPIWADPGDQSGVSVVLAVLGFSVQVYCDFSGYTDIARGSALLLGYRIPENFRSPYFSISFSELWSRWHITLSTWLRDYLYIPLGGSRVAPWRHNLNSIIVMSLGGLWHGNTYTFFLWGLLHGIFLAGERKLGKFTKESSFPLQLVGWILVTLGWLLGAAFFRAGNWETLSGMGSSLLHPGGTKINGEQFWTLFFLCYGIQFMEYKNYFKEKLRWNLNVMIPVLSIVLYFAIAKIQVTVDQFIYFQF